LRTAGKKIKRQTTLHDFTINNTAISDEYRFYVVSFIYNGSSHYSLWGLDDETGEDKLLLDENKLIRTFSSIAEMTISLNANKQGIFEDHKIKKWVAQVNENLEVAVYDIDALTSILKKRFNDLNKKDKIALLNFGNLSSDYAYQIQDKEGLKFTGEENNQLFSDFVTNNFLWDTPKD